MNVVQDRKSGMLFTNKINRWAPRILPYRTPDRTGAQPDWHPSIMTCWNRSERKSDNQCNRGPVIPKLSRFEGRRLCGTELKAFSKSKNIALEEWCLSSTLAHTWNKWINWVEHEKPGRKPNWWLLNKLLDSIKAETWL